MGMAELYRELPWQHAGARQNGKLEIFKESA